MKFYIMKQSIKVNNHLFYNHLLICIKSKIFTLSEKRTKNEVDENYLIKSESNKKVDKKDNDIQLSKNSIESDEKEATSILKKLQECQQPRKATRKQKFVVSILLCHVALQFFLPYSHFISKVSKLLTSILH